MSFKVLAISPPHARAGEMSDAVALLRAGVERYHLRKPGMAASEIWAIAREIPTEFRAHVSLHGPPALAAELGLGGVHGEIPQNDQRATGLRRSVSLHALDAGNGSWDYAVLSPIFASLSKPGRHAAFAAAALQQFLSTRLGAAPVYALGGITAARLPECRALGFAGAAALGFLWGGGDPVANGRALLQAAAEIRDASTGAAA